MTKTLDEIVYSPNTIEFVTVCVEYCLYLEKLEEATNIEVSDKLTKILPLLYLKASVIPDLELLEDGYLESAVSEDDYTYILSKMNHIYGADDTYLEVFLQDMKYSDTPISASISEDLADIYQDTRNFIAVYERGVSELMNDALVLCIDNFKEYWGQKLVNVLRALHNLKYNTHNDTLEYDGISTENVDEVW